MHLDPNQDLLSQLPWNHENLENLPNQQVSIFYFSLSTCAYCKKGLVMLQEMGMAVNWLQLDLLELETKQFIKEWIVNKYNLRSRMASPFVIFRLQNQDYISNGFDPDYWKTKLR